MLKFNNFNINLCKQSGLSKVKWTQLYRKQNATSSLRLQYFDAVVWVTWWASSLSGGFRGKAGRRPPPGSESGPKWAPLGPLQQVTVMWCCSNFRTIQSKSSIISHRLLAVTWSDVVKPLSTTTPRSHAETTYRKVENTECIALCDIYMWQLLYIQ